MQWSGQEFSTEIKAQIEPKVRHEPKLTNLVYPSSSGRTEITHGTQSKLSFHEKLNLLNRQNEENTGL